ncbi:MAG: phage head-tail connector protein [Anaerotignaceae bacterium]
MNKLDRLKILLGISGEVLDNILTFILAKTEDFICSYCHTNHIPEELETVQLSMCCDVFRAESYGAPQPEGVVKSISEGDISVSYSYISQSFIKNYYPQLDEIRKVRW